MDYQHRRLHGQHFLLPSNHVATSAALGCTNPAGQQCSGREKFIESIGAELIRTNAQMSIGRDCEMQARPCCMARRANHRWTKPRVQEGGGETFGLFSLFQVLKTR